MAVGDPLHPDLILTNNMGSNSCENGTFLGENSETDRHISNSHLFQVEQTEPLNLCLSGSVLNGFIMVETENENLNEKSDDDVIFVREFPVNEEKLERLSNAQKSSKTAPRRNPVRKARIAKRFEEEYTDIDFEENDFFEDTDADNDPLDIDECYDGVSEDTDDWKIVNVPKKDKIKRKVIGKTNSCRMGRRKKVNKTDTTVEKVDVKEIESAIQRNLFLLKDYIEDVKTVNKLFTEKVAQKSERNKNALNIFKQQVILLSIVKETDPLEEIRINK